MKPHKIGNRVKRLVDPFDKTKGYKYGTVINKYTHFCKTLGISYPELYSVLWDSENKTSKGHLRHGLRQLQN